MVQISATADQRREASRISMMRHPKLFILIDVGFVGLVYICLTPKAMKTIHNRRIALDAIAPDSESQ